MNKIFKVIYSKTKHCYVVVSELAKSHCKTAGSHTTRNKTALTAAVLLALGTFSVASVFMPMTAEAADKTKTDGSNFVGVERTDGLFDDSDYANYKGQGAHGDDSITVGLKASGGDGTITIGDRRAEQSLGSVYVGRGPGMPTGKVLPDKTDNGYWATSVGYQSDATGYGSIAIGSNATANNSYDKDSTGHGITLRTTSGDGKTVVLNGKPDIQRASVAIGYGASADNGNIAIGSYSDASTDLRTAKTADGKEIQSYLTDKKADSYVSVGKSDALRRISNVADGATATDVATVGQLQALSDKVGVYDEGFGIKIASDTNSKTNTISLDRNLGKDYDTTDGVNLKNDADGTSLILGGRVEKGNSTGGQTVTGDYGALGKDSVTVGGVDNTVETTGDAAVVVGGIYNKAAGKTSAVVGGSANDAIGNESSVFGGFNNDATGLYATISGGSYNRTYGEAASVFGGSMNNAVGSTSSVFGGSINTANGIWSSVVGGSHNTTLGLSSTAVGGENAIVDGKNSVGIAGGSTKADNALAAGNEATVTVNNGTAIGYQATANKEGTVAFGHDKGDVYYTSTWPQKATKKDGKYYDADNKEITEAQYEALRNEDKTFNDYSKNPIVTEKPYTSAAYNRLVKVADGVDDHDVVVMEQLDKAKTELTKDLSVNAGWGINIADEKDEKTGAVTKENVISLDRNLGTNLDQTGHVYLDVSKTGLVLGTVVDGAPGTDVDLHYGATGDYAVTVGGGVNTASGKASVVIGGSGNTASNEAAVSSGGSSNVASGSMASVYGGFDNEASGTYASIFAGAQNKASNMWTAVGGGALNEASGTYASIWGGYQNKATDEFASVYGGVANSAYGTYSSILGGGANKAGSEAVVSGGIGNEAAGFGSAVVGGEANIVTGANATALGGIKGSVNGVASVGILGGSTGMNAPLTLAAGYQSTVTDTGVTSTPLSEEDVEKIIEAGGTHPGLLVSNNDIDNPSYKILDHFATAIGYQATADEAQTVAFGHDKGDTYYGTTTYTWKQKATVKDGHYYNEYGEEIDENSYKSLMNADGTWNDYSQPIATVEEKKYDSAYYNRLVKVADGIDDHDVVVMEQLKQYAEKDASNLGNNIKVYKTDENGNVQLGDDKKPIEDKDATTTAQKANKDTWGKALGADTFSTGTSDKTTDASTSDQLVTGKTLYDYDAPVAETGKKLTYVSANNTTGQNLTALDAQVAANTSTLNDKTHNIKYYSVNDQAPLSNIDGYSNEGNDGAKGRGSIAAGFNTHADGIASTVVGSYSGVLNQNVNGGFRGATALSYGTFNINQNTDPEKSFSGVANSIIGQANATTNSNAAIIYGAGNTVTNSYRGIDGTNVSDIMKAASSKDVKKLYEALQKAVPNSGAQVMVMGGGNSVDKAYMTQVTGVGNKVSGQNSIYEKGTSTQYNFVDGFQNELSNGQHDYIIGTENKVSGDSVDKNQSNIIFGDNHKLTNQKNNVIIGSSDTADDETAASNVVIIGHNAKVSAEGGVAIGSGSQATVAGNTVAGYDAKTGKDSEDTTATWKATNAAVSIGTADGKVTRQINGLAAGTKDTDAVNVAQLKKLEGMKANIDATNIGKNLKGADGKTASTEEITANENAWGTAIGTGKVADPTQSTTNDPTQNGSQQLVTGGEVYKALHGGLDDVVFGHDGKDGQPGKDGSIGLVGQTGQKGEDGKNAYATTIIKTEKGVDGVDGKNGKDGITRIVYNDTNDPANKHTVATLDDGMKYAGDTGDVASVKLDHQLKLSGTTFGADKVHASYDDKDWTSDNIAVVSSAADETTGDAVMNLKLAKNLQGLHSSTYTSTETTGEGDQKQTTDYTTTVDSKGVTIQSKVTKDGKPETVNGPSMTIDGINGGGKQITNVGDGFKKNADGSYTISETDKKNAANIGDVQTIVDKAKKDLTDGTDGTTGLNKKANVDASNIGSNITVAPIYKKDDNGKDVVDQKATEEAEKTARTANENAWGTAIGTGEVAKDNGQLVTGKTVYDALHGGLDDVVFGHDGKDGKDGSIGLVGQTGKKGEDGKNAYATTIIKTEKGVDGVDGKNGEDGITRIVYNDTNDPANKHTVATLDDGMKYAGDTGDVANVKLDHQLKLSGTTFNDKDKKYDANSWTSDNIAVVSSAADETTGDATMYLKLNKDLNLTDKGSVRFGDKDSNTTLDASGLTIKSTVTKEGKTEVVSGPSMTKDGINGGSKAITNIGSGIEKDKDGNYTDKSKSSAANIGDVQTIVNDAKKDLTDGKNGLNSKANVDASNIGENLKDAKGNKASADAIMKNKEAWASAIGTNEVKEGNKQLVTSDAVAKELAKKADKSYVDQELGKKADKTYVDEKLDTKANKSDVYTKDETYSRTEVDSKVTNITKGLDGKAGKDLDNISDKGKTAIHNIAKDAVEVVKGKNTMVTKVEGTDTTPTKYAVNVEGTGKVASGDTGLISGDTLYKEVHVDKDGSYIKGSNTVGQNLSALDTGLKTTSDLIHTNDKGDTIQIGGNSTATKIDVSGKDANGNTTGRVITGVVSDANDPNSAANVGYVNGLTAANTQQIYRDMNNAYSRLDTNINRAAAGSNALAALHPLDFDPADKASFAVGYGHYHNANAAAVGAFYQPNANTMVNMGISLGNGDPGFNAGVSFKIGKGSAYNGVSKAEMAQTIHDQAAEISTIKANDAAKDKRIDALEKENQEIKEQIQEILARLNG